MNGHHLYLIGADHDDLKGPERLNAVLNRINPTSCGHPHPEDLLKYQLAHNDPESSFRAALRAYEHAGSPLSPRESNTLRKMIHLNANNYGYEKRVLEQYAQTHPSASVLSVSPPVGANCMRLSTEIDSRQYDRDSNVLEDLEALLMNKIALASGIDFMNSVAQHQTDQMYQHAHHTAMNFRAWASTQDPVKACLGTDPESNHESKQPLAYEFNFDAERDMKMIRNIRTLHKNNQNGHTLVTVDPVDRYLFQTHLSDLPLISGSLDRQNELQPKQSPTSGTKPRTSP